MAQAELYSRIHGEVDNLYRACNHVTATLANPIPFPYFHAVCASATHTQCTAAVPRS